jgi:hypothetical protein
MRSRHATKAARMRPGPVNGVHTAGTRQGSNQPVVGLTSAIGPVISNSDAASFC